MHHDMDHEDGIDEIVSLNQTRRTERGIGLVYQIITYGDDDEMYTVTNITVSLIDSDHVLHDTMCQVHGSGMLYLQHS